MKRKSFGSDNHAGVHPDVLDAIVRAGEGDQPAYGDDEQTAEMREVFRERFGPDAVAYPVFNGSAANVLCLGTLLRRYEAVICAESAHVYCDECGAPERFLGVKLLPVGTADGKLTPDLVASQLTGLGFEHAVQPKAVSISQTTELGTCYTAAEISALAGFLHDRDMYLHVDGARLANAAASQGCSLREMTTDAGVDVLSFGGTKNGAMAAEAVVILRRRLADDFKFHRKQGMQLASKMRFISAQLSALLHDDLWLRNARQANVMARRLAGGLDDLDGVRVDYPVQANAVFASLAEEHIAELRRDWLFHVWDAERSQVRLMTAFDTQPSDVDEFLAAIRAVAAK